MWIQPRQFSSKNNNISMNSIENFGHKLYNEENCNLFLFYYIKPLSYHPIIYTDFFVSVCRIYLDNLALDGEFNSKVFPLADTSRRDYPIDQPIDCTWEMLADRNHRVSLGINPHLESIMVACMYCLLTPPNPYVKIKKVQS